MILENADVPSTNETPPPTPSAQSPPIPGQYDIPEYIPTANVLLNPPLWNQVLQR